MNSRYLMGDSALVNFDLLEISGLLSSKETQQHALGIPSAPPSTTFTNSVSNTPTQPPPPGRLVPHPPHPPTQSSAVAYPPPRGFPWKCIAAMMRKDKSCPGCHFNKPDTSPRLKFHQELGCLALAKHGYMCRKDVTASATIVDQFNTKFPRMIDQSHASKLVAKRVSEIKSFYHVSSRRVQSPSNQSTVLPPHPPLNSRIPPAPPGKNLLLLPNQSVTMTTSNGYADLYSFDSEDEPVFA